MAVRQKANWASIKEKSAEERKAPMAVYEIPSESYQPTVKSFFHPVTGRRETVELSGPGEERRLLRSLRRAFLTTRRLEEMLPVWQDWTPCCELPREKIRRMSLTSSTTEFEGKVESRPRVRLQGNQGHVAYNHPAEDEVRLKILPATLASTLGTYPL